MPVSQVDLGVLGRAHVPYLLTAMDFRKSARL